MTRRLISSGSPLEARFAYSRAVVDGDWVHVSGTTGFDYAAGTISDDLVEQTEQIFRNVDAALTEAGASMADVVRVTYYVLAPGALDLIGHVLRRWLDAARPAATAIVVAGLVDPRMKIEIEVTARHA
jgi:enamine deaminase RidA (YjgF/YER057c/UK114 family)